MDIEFFISLDEGSLQLWSYAPWWLSALVVLAILIPLFIWGRKSGIRSHANRFHKKYFGTKYLLGKDRFDGRERQALKILGQGYMVIEQLDDPNKGSNQRPAPITLWKINDTRNGGHIIATPIPGYVPTKGEMVQLMSWTTERFDRKNPAFIHFIEPVQQEAGMGGMES